MSPLDSLASLGYPVTMEWCWSRWLELQDEWGGSLEQKICIHGRGGHLEQICIHWRRGHRANEAQQVVGYGAGKEIEGLNLEEGRER